MPDSDSSSPVGSKRKRVDISKVARKAKACNKTVAKHRDFFAAQEALLAGGLGVGSGLSWLLWLLVLKNRFYYRFFCLQTQGMLKSSKDPNDEEAFEDLSLLAGFSVLVPELALAELSEKIVIGYDTLRCNFRGRRRTTQRQETYETLAAVTPSKFSYGVNRRRTDVQVRTIRYLRHKRHPPQLRRACAGSPPFNPRGFFVVARCARSWRRSGPTVLRQFFLWGLRTPI